MKPIRLKCRRGSTLALVLCLYLSLGAILGGAVTMAATASHTGERDYRRSQALALAEAGVAEARANSAPHGDRPLGEGAYSWSATPSSAGRLVVAKGAVRSVSGATVTRTVGSVSASSPATSASTPSAAWPCQCSPTSTAANSTSSATATRRRATP